MKVAVPHWQARISPVFDVAENVLVVELRGSDRGKQHNVSLHGETMHERAAELSATGADVLICGAISRPLETAISAAGIEVIPQTCGDVDQVLKAFAKGELNGDAFLMPGCCGRRRRLRRRLPHRRSG